MAKQTFSESERGTIVRLFSAGVSITTLADGFQTGTAVVERIIRDAAKAPANGAKRAKRRPRAPQPSHEDVARSLTQ